MQLVKTNAIVLRRTNYGESDRILQLLTADGNKVSAMARGVRKEKSKLAGAVELFSLTQVTLHSGKSDLSILTSARLETFYGDILNDYDRLQFGYEVLKKVGKLSEHTHEPLLYEVALIALQSLNQTKIDLRIVRAWFYLQSAEISGHGLNLSRDNDNKPLVEGEKYRFDIAEMSFVIDSRGNFTADHLKLLKVLKIKTPAVVAHISGIEALLDDITSLAHAVSE
ncbi:MAG: DNA repair protein RecO [Candidatus Saccharibacteria bacterium]|nr:DNA repair protein RecO [Candidatus Saccharibacteria bacterium]